jgi:hypothetical protein
MPSLTAHEERVYTALKGGGGPLTVGEVASATGLESREALAALRAGREPPLAKRDVDEGREVEVWIALLGD